MTLPKFLPTIHIHPVLMAFVVISFLTGTFMELIIILSIVFLHELGHYFMAQRFKWRIRSVMLWVFGGVMDTDEHGNRPIREEVLVTIAGPFQHIIIYILLSFLSNGGVVPASVIELAVYYNTIILVFNLLPIWPLDGGKLLFLGLSALLPYKKAYHAVIIFSMVASLSFLFLQFLFYPFTLSTFLIMIFLFMENKNEWKQRYYVFIRFLLKRYEGNSSIKEVYPIVVTHENSLMDVFSFFRREKKHSIYITFPSSERKFMDESDCLQSYFHGKNYNKTIGEIVEYIP
ncbi:M50 family metallopeptidase [Virgibacillus sp. C22-A2]|uniref:M50 family metallopeptidase n=1 Tax=Virgibacillus tibetensis TaxID=3042313 RepID=A0ABU6K9L2_9BACI|nr:M50 family metallopeptidase [Virgibacillus sp. C22-A2]